MTEGAACTFLWQECFIVFTTKQIMMPRRRQAGSQPVAQAHLQRYNVSLPFVSASVSWAQWDLFSPFVCFQWPINSLDKPTEKDFSRSFLYFFFLFTLSPSTSLCSVACLSEPRTHKHSGIVLSCLAEEGKQCEKVAVFLERTGIGLTAHGSSPRSGNNAVASRP